ncbi:E3 binding domain-containing protein, partial [Acinetobacter sp. UBA6526]
PAAATATQAAPAKPQAATTAAPSAPAEKLTKEQEAENAKVYAGPAVRKLARELGVILGQVKASGEHGRVMKDDVFAYVKARLT